MRKKLISICVLLPLLLGIAVFDMMFTSRVTDECAALTLEARACVERSDYAGARAALNAAERRYLEAEGLLCVWETHADIDQIAMAFQCAQNGLFLQNRAVAMEFTSQLLHHLEHLDHQDDFSFLNIF